jgi:hypothetical protein
MAREQDEGRVAIALRCLQLGDEERGFAPARVHFGRERDPRTPPASMRARSLAPSLRETVAAAVVGRSARVRCEGLPQTGEVHIS